MATYKPQVKQENGTMADLNLDAATLNGKAESALSVSYAASAGSAVDQTARNGLDGKISYGGVVQNTNPFGGKKLYINSIDNALYAAGKRFWVTATKHKISDSGKTYPYTDTTKAVTDDNYFVDGPVLKTFNAAEIDSMFNGAYEDAVNCGVDGEYTKIRIMFGSNTSPSETTSYFSGYPYGTFYLNYYYYAHPSKNSEYRVYNKYASAGLGWKKFTFSTYVGNETSDSYIEKVSDETHFYRSCIEFIIYGHTRTPDHSGSKLTDIEWQLSRPALSKDGSTVTKYGINTIYFDLLSETEHDKSISLYPSLRAVGFRDKGSYISGMYYSIPGNEALVFANNYNSTSWMFVSGVNFRAGASWQGFTPDLQIKNKKVSINKLIANGTEGAYNLDVNGTANATTIYENGSKLEDTYAKKSSLATVATSGSYNDLSNKPTRIANADNADHADEADMAFSANTAQYASSAGEADHAGYAAQLDATLPISGGGTGATTAAAARTNLGLKAVASSGSYTDLTNKPTIVSQVKVGDTAYNPVNGVVSLPAYPTPSGGGKLYKHTIEMMCTMSMNFDEIRLTYYSTSETAFNDVPSLFAYLSGVDSASPVPFSEYKKQIYPCFILDTMGSSVYGSGTAAIYYDPNISTPMGMGDYVMDYVYVNGFNERAEELGHITEDFMIENMYSAVAEM